MDGGESSCVGAEARPLVRLLAVASERELVDVHPFAH